MVVILPAAALLMLMLVALGGRSAGKADRPGSSSAPKSRFTGRKSSDLITYDIIQDVVSQTPEQIRVTISNKLGRQIPINVLALAGAIASESSGPYAAQVGIGWAIKNKATRDGKSIFSTVASDGRFAAQGLPGHGYVSTRLPPTKNTLAIAEAILASPPRIKDPTGGAVQFDSPKAQRALYAKAPGYNRTPEQVAADRRADGRREVHLPGVSPDDLRFWA